MSSSSVRVNGFYPYQERYVSRHGVSCFRVDFTYRPGVEVLLVAHVAVIRRAKVFHVYATFMPASFSCVDIRLVTLASY